MSKTIEDKALEGWGATEVPHFCVYVLTNGQMLNGSFMGMQRDRDHREINEFMPHIKDRHLYDGVPYVRGFMKRGNIRVNAAAHEIDFQFWKIPTYEQWQTIRSIIKDAEEIGQIIRFEKWYPNRTNLWFDEDEFKEWYRERVNFCLY